ncbi:MAG: hypothetical protein ACK4ND_13600 [Cytophagaceae bacterium]
MKENLIASVFALIFLTLFVACSSPETKNERGADIHVVEKVRTKWIEILPDSVYASDYINPKNKFVANYHPNYLFDGDTGTYWATDNKAGNLFLNFKDGPEVPELIVTIKFKAGKEGASKSLLSLSIQTDSLLLLNKDLTQELEQIFSISNVPAGALRSLTLSFIREYEKALLPIQEIAIKAKVNEGYEEDISKKHFKVWSIKQKEIEEYMKEPILYLTNNRKSEHSYLYKNHYVSDFESTEEDRKFQNMLPMHLLKENPEGLRKLFNNLLSKEDLEVIHENFINLEAMRSHADSGYVLKEVPKPPFKDLFYPIEIQKIISNSFKLQEEMLIKNLNAKFQYVNKEQEAYHYGVYPYKIIERKKGHIKKCFVQGYSFHADFHRNPYFFSENIINYNTESLLQDFTSFYNSKELQFIRVVYDTSKNISEIFRYHVNIEDYYPNPQITYKVEEFKFKQ